MLPCGLWQSVHFIRPSGTRWCTGRANCAWMLPWQREAQIRLGLLQQAVVQPARRFRKLRNLEESRLRVRKAALALIFDLFHQVGRMAFVAGDARRRVLRVGKRFLLLAGDVAGQAAFRVFLGTAVEREDQLGARHFLGRVARRILFGIRMSFAGAVAGFASGNAGRRRSGRAALPCRRSALSASSGNPRDC